MLQVYFFRLDNPSVAHKKQRTALQDIIILEAYRSRINRRMSRYY